MKNTFFIVLFFSSFVCFSQNNSSIFGKTNKSDLPIKSEHTPKWANFFYEENPKVNVYNLDKEVNLWIQENITKYENGLNITSKDTLNNFRKDKGYTWYEKPYVRFYRQWRKHIPTNWIAPDGTLTPISTDEYYSYIKKTETLQKTTQMPQAQASNSSWSLIGPMQTYKSDYNGGPTYSVPWQVNVYFVDSAPSNTNTLICSTDTGLMFGRL